MIGHFDVHLKDLPRGVTDAHLRALMTPEGKATPELNRLLASMPTRQRAQGKNLISDNFAGATFQHVFNGGGVSAPYNTGDGWLSMILLMTTDSEPAYTDASSDYTSSMHTPSGNIGGVCAKRFIEDDIDPYLIDADPDSNTREAVLFRSRFLYISTEANSSNIRSLGVYHSDNLDTTGWATRGRIARIRLKDSGGNPIIINKTSAQVLLIEYRLTLVSI